jgi:hypothetical protein
MMMDIFEETSQSWANQIILDYKAKVKLYSYFIYKYFIVIQLLY